MDITDITKSIGDTDLIEALFPKKPGKKYLFIEPFSLINSKSFINMLSNNTKVTFSDKEKGMLNLLFGDDPLLRLSDSVKETIGSINISSSTDGKTNNVRNYFVFDVEYNTDKVNQKNELNFIYFDKGDTYSIDQKAYVSSIKTLCINTETKKYDDNLVNEAIELISSIYLNGSRLDLTTFEKIRTNVKSKKTSLSKIILSVLPDIGSLKLNTVVDIVNSEVISKDSTLSLFKNIYELKGDLITYFYNKNNYVEEKGILGSSCMRGSASTERIRFYALNKESISMLSYIVDKKLYARAILWKDVDGYTYVDRIYYIDSKYGTLLANYCKKNGYRTVHSITADSFGITRGSCIVKLTVLDIGKDRLIFPYLDSMYCVDPINKYISNNEDKLEKFLIDRGETAVISNYAQNAFQDIYRNTYSLGKSNIIIKGKNRKISFLKTSENKSIQLGGLQSYALIKKPTPRFINKQNVTYINNDTPVEASWANEVLLKKYNHLVETISIKNGSFQTSLFEKHLVVYSKVHKSYIPERQSLFSKELGSFVLKDYYNTSVYFERLRIHRTKKLYAYKLVKIDKEYIKYLKDVFYKLPIKDGLLDIRHSRTYCINPNNIGALYVTIKNIQIPVKHLRIVKNGKQQNQKQG